MSGPVELASHADPRGHLVSLTGLSDLPFEIKRVFYIYGNVAGLARAGHAHNVTTEVLVAVHGSCRARIEDRAGERTVMLDRPDLALLLEPMTWLDLTEFTPDCVLLVLADTAYLPELAITDVGVFREHLG